MTTVIGLSVEGDESDLSAYTQTHSGLNGGTAPEDCVAIVVLHYLATASRSLSGITIGGAAMTEIEKQSVSFFAQMGLAIYAKSISASSSLQTVATFSNTMNYCDTTLYLVTGISSLTPIDTFDQAYSSGQTSYSVDMDVVANAIAIAAGTLYTGPAIPVTWSGATEQYDEATDSNSSRKTGAVHIATGTESPRSISFSWSGSQSVRAVGAVFPGTAESAEYDESVTLSGRPSVVAGATLTLDLDAAISVEATATAVAQAVFQQAASISGEAGLNDSAFGEFQSSVAVSANTAVNVVGTLSILGTVTISADGTITSIGGISVPGSVVLSSLSDITTFLERIVPESVSITADGVAAVESMLVSADVVSVTSDGVIAVVENLSSVDFAPIGAEASVTLDENLSILKSTIISATGAVTSNFTIDPYVVVEISADGQVGVSLQADYYPSVLIEPTAVINSFGVIEYDLAISVSSDAVVAAAGAVSTGLSTTLPAEASLSITLIKELNEPVTLSPNAYFQVSQYRSHDESVTFVVEARVSTDPAEYSPAVTFSDFVGLIWVDEINDSTETEGTGTLSLIPFGQEPDARPVAVIGDGNSFVYRITSELQWELGIGTYDASTNSISRDTIIASSNAGSAVSWGPGRKSVTGASLIEIMGYVIETLNGILP